MGTMSTFVLEMRNHSCDLWEMTPPLPITRDQIFFHGVQYNKSYLSQDSNSICVTRTDRYYWGFSAWTLIFAVVIHALWCYLVLFVHIYTKKRGRLCREGSYLQQLKATVDLGSFAMRGLEYADNMKAKELDERMKNCRVSYQVCDTGEARPTTLDYGVRARSGQDTGCSEKHRPSGYSKDSTSCSSDISEPRVSHCMESRLTGTWTKDPRERRAISRIKRFRGRW